MYKWKKSPLTFECLKTQIICIIDNLFKLHSIITEAGGDNAWEGKDDDLILYLQAGKKTQTNPQPTGQNPTKYLNLRALNNTVRMNTCHLN